MRFESRLLSGFATQRRRDIFNRINKIKMIYRIGIADANRLLQALIKILLIQEILLILLKLPSFPCLKDHS